ncbi:hypothetical protein T03_16570 [Trichinella britovi]|uniref:Uncharacterized protein n=1 Tax=Trichinella britovi TaxID=45882 RepID=A0A0V1BPD5_TRIBR|nr:hypothetical protein T03_16570 [Trichinella britovi]
MIDAVASPVVPSTNKSKRSDGSPAQLTQFQQKFLSASENWQSSDVVLQVVYDDTVECVSGSNEPSSHNTSRLQKESPGKGSK